MHQPTTMHAHILYVMGLILIVKEVLAVAVEQFVDVTTEIITKDKPDMMLVAQPQVLPLAHVLVDVQR